MRPLMLFLLFSFFLGCAASDYSSMTEDYRQALSSQELTGAAFFVATRMDFVSLKAGDIVGQDIFKHEVKKTITIERDTPGKLVASGAQWLTIEFNHGVLLTFRWDPVEEKYLTPSWGTITIQNERFDIRQGVLSGRFVELLVAKNR